MMEDNRGLTADDQTSLRNAKQINIRSDEVEDILSYIPHWIIRWGITVIFISIVILLITSWVIEYPDVIPSRITILTQNPPVSIVARTNGKLTKLFVQNNDWVTAQTYLGVMENPAQFEGYLILKQYLLNYKKQLNQTDQKIHLIFNKALTLGELQSDYSDFQQKYQNYKLFYQLNYHPRKMKAIESQIEILKLLQSRLIKQKEILQKETDLSEKNYLTNKTLFEKGLLSEIDLTTNESEYLQKKYALESSEASIINNNIQIAEYQQDIMDLDQQFQEQDKQLTLGLHESFKKLESAIASWEQRYVLISPIDGRISFYKFWSLNQYVNQNDEIMSVVPSSIDLIGKIYLTGFGTGKIKNGQKVKIKFDGYPYHEFGIVNGYVESVSLAAHESNIAVTVNLPVGLKTSYNKSLDFKQGMSGQAEIITEDLKLIERIFNQFRYLFTDRM